MADERDEHQAMSDRRAPGSLGPPVRGRGMPVIPSRWRLPALVVTVILCIALFVAAVLIGTHG